MTPHDPEEFRTAHAIRDALPTRVHAEMLFDQVADLLGPAAWIDTFNQGKRRELCRRDPRDPDRIIPWPLVMLGIGGRLSTIIGGPQIPPSRPGRAPRLHGLGPGEICLQDGPHAIIVTYGEDGRWAEVLRQGPPETHAAAGAALSRKSAPPVEILAEYAAGLDAGRHGPGRLLLPLPFPDGARALWMHGRRLLCDALYTGRIPDEAAWAVSDSFTGDAVAWGGTPGEALSAWRAEVERVRPWTPKPEAPPPIPNREGPQEDGKIVLIGPSADTPMPDRSPAHTPAVLVSLAPPPDTPPPVGTWKRMLGNQGATTRHLFRPDPGGFTLFGERLLSVLPLAEIDARMDRADAARDALKIEFPSWPDDRPPLTCFGRVYRLVDDATGTVVEPFLEGQSGRAVFQASEYDGDLLQWRALRVRWEQP